MTVATTRQADTPPPLTHGLLELTQLLPCEVRYRKLMTSELLQEAKAALPAWQAATQPARPEWIAQRIRGLLAHWKQPDLSEMEIKFVARDWVATLSEYPASVIDAACIEYARKGKFRPTPADIVERCEDRAGELKIARRLSEFVKIPVALPAPAERPVTKEERARVGQMMASIRMKLTNVEEMA